MKKNVNIAVIGLGQIGIYLYNELQKKKKLIELKTGKKIKIVGISARNKNKKRRFTIDKKIFFSNPLDIIKKTNVDIELKKIIESAAFAKELGLNCHAGHGLSYDNVSSIVSISDIVELNIGHFIIANSIFDGLENSILKMRNIISEAIK